MPITIQKIDTAKVILNRDYHGIEAIWRNANSAPGHQVIDREYAVIVDAAHERAVYYFAKPGQQMHPGVVRRTFIENINGVSIRTEGWSFGLASSQPAFEQWLEAFQALSAEIKTRMRRGRPAGRRGE
jgi:hypothetical protein